MSEVPTLVTERLRIREARVEDADSLHLLYADADALRWWSHPPSATIEETRERFAESLAASDWRRWAISLSGDDRAIGTLGAHEKRQGGVIEIGYSLARTHWGAGLAREAVAALLDQLFRAERHRRAFADTDPDNAASNRLLGALGFTLEGRLRAEWDTHIGVRDSLIWGLLREEWTSS